MAALLLATTVVTFAPAVDAQQEDVVPTKPSIKLTPIPSLRQFLYARFGDADQSGQQPNCDQRALALEPAEHPSAFTQRSDCVFTTAPAPGTGGTVPVTVPGAIGSGAVTFTTPPSMVPNRRVGFTGNDTSFVYHHAGMIPQGLLVDVNVVTGSQTIASGRITGNGGDEYTLPLTLAGPTAHTGRVFAEPNVTFSITLTPQAPQGPAANVGQPVQWAIDDTNTYLELRADDAIRAALWVTDEKDVVRDFFAPIANESQLPTDRDRRIVGHFALASAFGANDARGDAPRFSVLLNGLPQEIGANGASVLTGVENRSASVTNQGVIVWSFPAGALNYRGFEAGAYQLHVQKTHHQGSPINPIPNKPFNITAQSVDLRAFVDPRVPSQAETQAHAVQPGGSTTYILAVNNTGFVNDTFTINLSAPNAPAGWGASIGGPDVLARRIEVPAGATRIFTVTVNAPFSTSGEAIHLVNVTSTLDPGARSRDLTLVTTIRPDVVRELGIIFLSRDLALEPGVETHFPVYVWNRGTRVANVSLEIQETLVPGWTVDLGLGNSNVDRLVLSSIQPGDIAEATLKVTGPISGTVPTHPITLNATLQDVSGVSVDRSLTFGLRLVAGVTVTVLNTVGSREHVVELGPADGDGGGAGGLPGGAPGGGACTLQDRSGCPDFVDGIWHRVWITNTGRSGEAFDLSADSVRSNCPGGVPGVFPDGGMTGDSEWNFYTRSPGGAPSRVSRIDIPAGKTAEVYVWTPVEGDSPCTGERETFSFVVQARGATTSVIGRGAADAIAVNNGGTNGVYLEGTPREPNYSNTAPYVDPQNATKRTIVGGIPPGGNATYFVRMTNMASWGNYTINGQRQASDLRISLVGVDYEGGWNVSIRPVLDQGQNDLRFNPYAAEYNLSNNNSAVAGGRDEAWIDRELEVVVQAPSIENGTALAGLRHEFQIIAETNQSNDRSTLEIATVVTDLANVSARADQVRVFAHPGEAGAFLLYVTNNGSSPADVTLRAGMNANNTPNSAAWQVDPPALRFPLPAFKNRTIALLVTPPAGSTQGSVGEVTVTLEYARNPFFPNATTNETLRLTTEVVAPGTLSLTPSSTQSVIGPGGTANFTMTLRNTGSLTTPFRLLATPIPNWTVTVSPDQGSLNPGETRTAVLVLRAPNDVTNDTRFASVVRVEEPNNAANFDSAAFSVNILGGKALPRISVPNLVKRVDRAGVQNFEVQVQNVGTAAGELPLEVRTGNPEWIAGITADPSVCTSVPGLGQRCRTSGGNLTALALGVNELVTVNVTVRAPLQVAERTVVPVELTAYSPDRTQAAKATLSAEIHDYGVQIALQPSTKDALPGVPTEFIVRVRNTGNDNDTLNLSTNLVDLPEWSVALSSQEVRLEPNQEVELRATVRSPTGPLPTARAYSIPFWVGTRGGQEVNISKNMTVSAVITIPPYRSYDVDRDGQLEITVDLDKRQANGFEEFRDIFTEGLVTQVVAEGLLDGRTTFFLDVPRDRPYDGVADVWFNPETVYAFEIAHAPDLNGDGTPEYLLDVDRDGRIDRAFDTATERFLEAFEVKVFGDDRIQYLADLTGDGKPDRFYDPETGTVTRTQRQSDLGDDYVGIDVDDDDRVDYYYNTRTRETSGAEVANFGDFVRDYWYFFLGFLAVVLVTTILLVRRRRAP